ncbi:hypothetical protein K523DRAFT_356091 [Schizophyllum commune Tattone D]|nr:hypothetical protein K523DRAFT_356091 [Schizophyllum commune Tattone D]
MVKTYKAEQAHVNELKLLNRNLEKQQEKHQETIHKWRAVFELIATHEVPGLQRVLSNAHKEGLSVDATYERVQKAIIGQYNAKNFTDSDIDIAMVLYEFGGAGAVHAAHKSHLALPCLKTLRQYRQGLSLWVSTAKEVIGDAAKNIKTYFEPRDDLPHERVGHGLAYDETAGDGRVCYLPLSDAMAGFCGEHVGELATVKMGSDLTNSLDAAQAVKDGRVHIGKEFTCAAILPHSRTRYGARPIILSPTCKRGLVSDSVQLLMSGVRAWQLSPHGESEWGPLWYISSDGDATRRRALYQICMRKPLDRNSPLYGRLRGCVGLNLWVGAGDLTMDFDYKHIFKRICTLLCSKDGLVVDNVHINKLLLSIWLEKLTHYSWSEISIHALLHPKDAQDVPRAIKLLMCVTELQYIETRDFTPSEKMVHRALAILGNALESLLEPFINRSLDLSQQVTHLVKAAHIFCALYRRHTTSFMPNQLYGDIQCMIKNAVFTVAKSQVLNPELEVFVCLLGDDLLESLFGLIRMLGGHSPNVDVSEMATRCRSAMNLMNIFRRHPEWERKPERLKMGRSRDYDHLGPRDWTPEQVVGKSCNIEKCWKDAIILASNVLQKHGLEVDFAALFGPRDHDLMRPFGGDYPGVSTSIDRSQVDGEVMHGGDNAAEGRSDEEEQNIEEDHQPQIEEATSDTSAVEAALSLAWSRLRVRAEVTHSVWMKLDDAGRERHKASILREVFDLTHDIDYHRTHDRILRIRCFSIGGDCWDRTVGMKHGKDLASKDRFEIGDLFATLIRTCHINLSLLHPART